MATETMSPKSYNEWLRNDFRKLIEQVKLDEIQRHYLYSRWLEQVVWMEDKAGEARRRYYLLRLTVIIGGILVPALVGLNAVEGALGNAVYWAIFLISLTVSISAGLEEFLKYGDRWRHFRQSVEELKVFGWQFFHLSGRFSSYETHQEAYKSFVTTMEEFMQREIQIYISNQNPEDREDRREPDTPPAINAAAEQMREEELLLSN